MKGTIVYEPIVLATGKTRRSILRKHAHNIFCDLKDSGIPIRSPPANIWWQGKITEFENNSQLWISRKHPIEEFELEVLLQIAQRINTYHPLSSLQAYEKALVLKQNIDNSRWCILQVERSIIQSKVLELRSAGINISGSAWGPHISVVRGETCEEAIWKSRLLEGQSIEFTLETNIRQNKQGYYWYNCASVQLEDLRIQLGLSPRPSPPFHLTLGRVS